MQLQFLGTSASEGYPNAFCGCENCEAARRLGGPSLRKRSSALINGELLIDMGPDLMAAALQHGVSLAQIRYCLQTHEHHDHLDPSHFVSRSPYCGVHGAPRLDYYASIGALNHVAAGIGRAGQAGGGLRDPEIAERLNLAAHAIEPFQMFAVGPYQVMSVAANHAPELTAMLFVIAHAGRVLFYGTDTSEMSDATWDALEAYSVPFNVVVLDHTFGYKGRSRGHMNTEQFLEQVARLHDLGLLAEDTRIYAQHIAHHSNPPHPELAASAAEQGYEIAYDGLVVDV